MSLLLSILSFFYAAALYWYRFGGQDNWQSDHWSFLKIFALALVVAAVVHRLVWIVLARLEDKYLNHPPPLYTSLSRARAEKVIRSTLRQRQHAVGDDVSGLAGEINAERCFGWSLTNYAVNYNVGRGMEELGGPLGAVFKFLGNITWFSGYSVSIVLDIKTIVVGLDDDCTYIKFDCKTSAAPEIINVWTGLERTLCLSALKTALQARLHPQGDEEDHDYYEEEVQAGDDDMDELDCSPTKKEQPLTEAQFQSFWRDAGAGDSIAQVKVGNALKDKGEYDKASQCYGFAIKQGNHDAELQLGLLMRDGLGINRNREEAFKLILRSAKYGKSIEAMYEVGICLVDGLGTVDDAYEAYKWFLKAAEQGHALAALKVGQLMDEHDYPKKDNLDSDHWCKQAARRGSVEAQVYVACQCLIGGAKESNFLQALPWFRLAALQGDAESQYQLGGMYLYHVALSQNLSRAKYWLERSVAQGSTRAPEYLQTCNQELSKYGYTDIH